MTKPGSTLKKIRKQHTPGLRQEVLKLAERISVAATELSLLNCDSTTGAANSNTNILLLNADRKCPAKSPV